MNRIVGSLFSLLLFSTATLAQDQKLPLNIEFSLGTSVGVGSFLPASDRAPDWTSYLSMTPSYQAPAFWGLPPISMSLTESFDITWLQTFGSSKADSEYRIKYSDLSYSASMPKAVFFEPIGLSLTPKFNLIGPISEASRALNRVLGIGGGLSVKWAYQGFSISYSPSATGWIHSDVNNTIPCGALGGLTGIVNPNNPDFSFDQLSLASVFGREQERLPNGRCVLSGRQSLAVVKNTLSFTWAQGNHDVSASLGWNLTVLRPLDSRPELRSPYASAQAFTEASTGRVAYSYTVPVDFNLSVSGGVLSYQNAYHRDGSVRFPFFDFFSPANNFTQIFIDLTAGI